MKKSIIIAAFFLATLVSITGALAHPHMFMDTTASFKIDGRNQLQSIKLQFVIDELNTTLTIATLDLDKDGDKKFSAEDKKKVASNVLEGFAHYNFFTYLQVRDKKIPVKAPTRTEIDLVEGHLVVQMEVFLNEPLPVSGKTLTLKLYDPSYFTEVSIKTAPQIIGGNKLCRVKFHKSTPDENSQKLQESLAQLSREETPEMKDVGALFADNTRLICAG